jgi:hypothetical protein
MEPIGGDTIFNAFIFPDGEVVYTPGDVFEAKCHTDISKYQSSGLKTVEKVCDCMDKLELQTYT